jgi:hypothetical protein
MKIEPALAGKMGELLVATELMRRNIHVGYPASDSGIDLLAYRLSNGAPLGARVVPVQVKTRSNSGYNFKKSWFDRVPGVALVQVWHVTTAPEFYIFEDVARVEEVLGLHANTNSWQKKGDYSITMADARHREAMGLHRDRWERIMDQLPITTASMTSSSNR